MNLPSKSWTGAVTLALGALIPADTKAQWSGIVSFPYPEMAGLDLIHFLLILCAAGGLSRWI